LVQKTAGLPTGITALLARKLKLPFIYWVENDIEVDNRLVKTIPYYALRMFNFGIKNADYIMTQNEYQYKTLRKVYPNRVFLVHNPFYPLGKTEARQQRNYVAWIGVYKNQKNLPALYHIARQTAEVTFKIAGIEPAEGVDVDTKKALRLLRLCPNVKFVGYLDRTKIMNFLGGAFALLNTSDYEGFSNTFLEAFSAGTPVVSLNSDPNGILKKYNLGYPINLENASIVIKDYFHEYDHNAFMKRGKRYLDMFHDYNNVSKKFLKVLNSN
jgi:glycosyltransferase involved in cell wall biosynthesis